MRRLLVVPFMLLCCCHAPAVSCQARPFSCSLCLVPNCLAAAMDECIRLCQMLASNMSLLSAAVFQGCHGYAWPRCRLYDCTKLVMRMPHTATSACTGQLAASIFDDHKAVISPFKPLRVLQVNKGARRRPSAAWAGHKAPAPLSMVSGCTGAAQPPAEGAYTLQMDRY